MQEALRDWLDEEENKWNRTKGVYYHTLIDLSTRLEKLEIPYTVGISREDKNKRDGKDHLRLLVCAV